MNARQPISANSYLSAFRRVSGILPGHNLGWLRLAREAAIERFANSGFPTQRDEDWKYTSVAAIENARFNLLPEPRYDLLASQVAAQALPDAHLLVFVNGFLEPGLSRLGRLPPGTILGSLGYMLEEHPGRLEEVLVVDNADSAFSDLNLAFMTDGAYVLLPPGATIKAPVQLFFIASETNLAIQPRNLVLAAAGSSATIVEHHMAAMENSYFTNAVTDIVLGPGASIEHHKLQQESPTAFHIAAVNVTQEAKSRFVSSSFALGARLARVGINVRLQAEDATCDLDGLYITDGRQHIDHHTRIDHLQPRCTSREFYKGVLGGASRAVFNGRVVVHPDAQGSDALQSNHNLLLSENAEIDTKPQLEIWADDVKCSHGATVGQLDEAQVFYLRSRGIDQDSARTLLTRAFAREVIDRVHLPSLQEKLDALLQEKLKGVAMLTGANELNAVQGMTLTLHVARLRQDFPILQRTVNGRPLVYLDNAATSQKPSSVIEAERHYYAYYNANIHRGVHRLSQEATDAYEAARDKVRDFIHARRREEIVFTRGTTESINLVANSYGQGLRAGDEILVTEMEHHSNIVPWQLLCQRSGALLRVAPIDDAGQLVMAQFATLLGPRTRLVALAHMSNALGTINPVRTLVEMVHRAGAVVLIDGAQAAGHLPVDVTEIGCDFYAFSGHKLYGPTGTGVLYARTALLEAMPPWQGGGDMIRQVSFSGTTWNDLPYKFEAGTPNIAGGIGLGVAIDYVRDVGLTAIAAHEADLLNYASEQARDFPGLTLVGTARDKGAILSFTLAGIHPHDVGTILDAQGVAVRTGHHCAMPVMERYGLPATVRASFALYNTRDEVDALFRGLEKAQEMFA